MTETCLDGLETGSGWSCRRLLVLGATKAGGTACSNHDDKPVSAWVQNHGPAAAPYGGVVSLHRKAGFNTLGAGMFGTPLT